MSKRSALNHKLGIIICLLFTSLAYSNIFNNDFVIDDYKFIVDWPLIHDLGNLSQFFGPHNQPQGEEGVYSPLKTLFHALNHQAWGQKPFGYHLVSIAVHLLATFFIYRIVLLLRGGEALAVLTAFIFGLHPVHVDAVTFMTASIDTLGVLFMFISFYFYIKKDSAGVPKDYALSLFFALLAIFTHELCISLPVLFLWYELCFQTSGREKLIRKLLPFFGMALVYVLFKFLVLHSVSRGGYLENSFYLNSLVALKALRLYPLVLFFPFQLAVNRPVAEGISSVNIEDFSRAAVLSQSFLDKEVMVSLILLGLAVLGAVRCWKDHRLVSFIIGWLYLSLLPVMNIVAMSSFFAERYVYPGSFGFAFGAAFYLCRLYENKVTKYLAVFLTIALLQFYFVRTILHNTDFKNELTFYENEANVNPQSAFLQHDLGVMYLRVPDTDRARQHFEKALILFEQQGKAQEIREVEDVLKQLPAQ